MALYYNILLGVHWISGQIMKNYAVLAGLFQKSGRKRTFCESLAKALQTYLNTVIIKMKITNFNQCCHKEVGEGVYYKGFSPTKF